MSPCEWNEVITHFKKFYDLSDNDLISPFGFETLDGGREKYYLKHMKRFYIYYRTDNTSTIEKNFLDFIKIFYPSVYKNIYVYGSSYHGYKIINDQLDNNYYFISLEKIHTYKNISDSYFEYLAGSLFFIANRQLPEFKKLNYNEMARLRIKQLFYINLDLYEKYTTKEMKQFSMKLDYSLKKLNFINHKDFVSENAKKELLNIVNFSQKILENINISSNSIKTLVLFGYGGIKKFQTNEIFFKKNVAIIKKRYREFYKA